MLKYPNAEELYLDSGIYGDSDDEYRPLLKKIVTCRKSHICGNCGDTIHPSNQALYEKAVNDEGIFSCYTCIPCIEAWLEEIGAVGQEYIRT